MLEGNEEYGLKTAYPFNAQIEDVLEISSRSIMAISLGDENDNRFKSQMNCLVMTAWGVLFNKISADADEYDNMCNCEAEYNEFISKLHEWVSPTAKTAGDQRLHLLSVKARKQLERVDWADVAIKGILIVAAGAIAGAITVIFPPAGVGIIAGMAITGGMVEGISELYEQFKRHEDINWGLVLTRTFGGALKGATLVIPGVNCLASGIGIGAIGTLENYICSALRGDASMDALGEAAIGGAVEGVSAGALKWVGKKLAGSNTKKIAPKQSVETRCQELTDEELAKVWGGSKNPKWKPNFQQIKNINYRKVFF